jgi:hypothetical protein
LYTSIRTCRGQEFNCIDASDSAASAIIEVRKALNQISSIQSELADVRQRVNSAVVTARSAQQSADGARRSNDVGQSIFELKHQVRCLKYEMRKLKQRPLVISDEVFVVEEHDVDFVSRKDLETVDDKADNAVRLADELQVELRFAISSFRAELCDIRKSAVDAQDSAANASGDVLKAISDSRPRFRCNCDGSCCETARRHIGASVRF